MNQKTQTFIETLAQAQSLGQEYDVFASVLIAQAILKAAVATAGFPAVPIITFLGSKAVIKEAA